ncbi:RNA 2',3'-cyclic phosphodiesterase [Lederbergia galactosidilytica]|uniref:RNA 2',3'-cyclic phosphodiesterase n=3 Tax=Lederbergia galactosidilytica TaxID=217031 RepID=A0A177ZJH5_9BACI|nr:RNA 2',3'-cyclic phosphodiesterase [Lederbergia galactosidilytica]KRG16069.1 hypothetical protein ACA30_03110 [Virgibacillus soli]MBP1915287.1 2'-5' RNA ligase [Lederbergia galactosidilytica]OAK68116.1 hypothetical protein ABB05_16250 [Lederbergia galactosidilytica]
MAEHYFFALALPDPIKEELASICKNVKNIFPFKKWVHPADYHITLAFLGAAEKDKLANAVEIMRENLADFKAPSLEITHLDTFGKRVFWAGLTEAESLVELQRKVYITCENAQFKLEKRPFHPHITLARKWQAEQELKKEQLVSYYPSLAFLANEVVLYKTHPERTPKYEKVRIFPLSQS